MRKTRSFSVRHSSGCLGGIAYELRIQRARESKPCLSSERRIERATCASLTADLLIVLGKFALGDAAVSARRNDANE